MTKKKQVITNTFLPTNVMMSFFPQLFVITFATSDADSGTQNRATMLDGGCFH